MTVGGYRNANTFLLNVIGLAYLTKAVCVVVLAVGGCINTKRSVDCYRKVGWVRLR